uniref:ATP synthase complex subunit 8 n=1 Tax=Eucidaris tribuloides TaxID=7632 RepID=A0A7G3KWP2_EUCTR|nr:ATP synthase subunit 8 [Eucidaris tribuloides]QEF30120.1 ATP synthase subunit 8 [Eucidaris tribuloides]QEF30133.1 ATP synthase subunit 8 [Eucidaris tribuloides]
MPQLEFTWWIINFFVIWVALAIAFTIITTNQTPSEPTTENEESNLTKTTNTWQWL